MSYDNATVTKKIGVCLNDYSDNRRLLDFAYEAAQRDGCDWYAIYVDLEILSSDPILKQNIDRALDRAKELGANIIRFTSDDRVNGIIAAAELYELSHIIIGRRKKSRIASIFNPTLASQLLKHETDFELQVITLDDSQTNSQGAPLKTKQHYVFSILLILAITTIVEIIQESLPEYQFNASIYNVSMVYLLAIVFCALRYGFKSAFIAAILSFWLYNFFFIPPFYTFGLGQVSDALNFILFLGASLVSVTVASSYKQNMMMLKERETAARALHELSKDIAGGGDLNAVINSMGQHMAEILNSDIQLIIMLEDRDIVYPDETRPDPEMQTLAREVLQSQKQKTSHGTIWFPVSTNRKKLGVVAIKEHNSDISLRLVEALCYQIALAIERALLMKESEQIKLQHQRESLRSALLSSVSHDLKTPLVSIIGSLSSIRHMKSALSEEENHELIDTAITEAERLNQFITNILNMTRIESGLLEPNREWVEVYQLLSDSVSRLSTTLEDRTIVIDASCNNISVFVDPTLFLQAFNNILENAVKYSPPETTVMCDAITSDKTLRIRIMDNGHGMNEADYVKAFDKFTRFESKDNRVAGTGLGLAICKAIVEIHNGAIMLGKNPEGRGLLVTIELDRYKINQQDHVA